MIRARRKAELAATGYLNGNCSLIARMIGKMLVSAGLVWPTGPAPQDGPKIADLMAEARLNVLPLMCLWSRHMPHMLRVTASRQYLLLTVLPLGLMAGEACLSFGVLCVANRLYESMSPGVYGDPIADAIMNAILLGGFTLFGKIAVLCAALAALCQPMHRIKVGG
jgi:hypothetical protein